MNFHLIAAIVLLAMIDITLDQCDVMMAPGHACDEIAMPWLGCDK